MKKLIAVCVSLAFLMSCSSLEEEAAGICVTCAISGTPEVIIEACSNGDGTITLTENGVETGTFQNDTESFRIAQTSTGSDCN